MIRRYIIWRNNHAYDERLRRIMTGRTLPDTALGILRLCCVVAARASDFVKAWRGVN